MLKANARRTGLAPMQLANTRGRVWVEGVVHRLTPRDAGLLLNRCPWCGVRIAPRERARKRATP